MVETSDRNKTRIHVTSSGEPDSIKKISGIRGKKKKERKKEKEEKENHDNESNMVCMNLSSSSPESCTGRGQSDCGL